MPRFTASLTKDVYYGETVQALPRDLVLIPQNWSGSDRGGCKQASLTATGSAESLAALCGWLGDKLEIYNEQGDCLWWGDLWDIELSLGNIMIHMSLDDVRNRVQVTYPTILADGSEESASTAWAQDGNSIERYGKRELIYGVTQGDAGSAVQNRDTILSRMSLPGPVVSTSDDAEYSATLTAQGSWYKADSVYFENHDGLEENTNESGSQVLGRYLISTQIGFGLWDDDPSREDEEMVILGGGTFAPLQPDDDITVSGSVAVGDDGERNNDTYSIRKMNHPYQIGIGSAFVDEAPGPAIKVSYGSGSAADIMAVRFSVDTAWTMTRVAVVMRKLGNPSDLVRVEINADGGGFPGTQLSSADVSGASMYTEMTWTEFAMPPLALTAGVSYWLQIKRLGTASLNDGYEIAVDEDMTYTKGETPGVAVGNMLVWTFGGSWAQRDPPCDMPFRIIAEIQSTEQLQTALDLVDGYWRNLVQVDSAIMVRQYFDGTRTVMDEITELLDMGTSSGERLVAWVTRDRATIVDKAVRGSTEEYVIGTDGRLRYPNGSGVAPGKLVYGQTVGIDSILLLDGIGGLRWQDRGASVYIIESSYSAESDRLSVRGEGSPDPFAALRITRA